MGGLMAETDQRLCNSGTSCKAPDERPYPTSDPLCPACLEAAARDIRALVFDYLDLAQLHEASMSQAITEKTSGSVESPMLLSGHVEALQAEIVHVVSVWEHAVRAVRRLSNPHTFAPLWRTTLYDHLDLLRRRTTLRPARPGVIVQRAAGLLAAHISTLAVIPAVTVCPTGIEDEPEPMHGWEAVHQLQALHGRCRGALGRTTRRFWIPGECWACNARPKPGEDGPLWRSEPKDFDDPMQVNCDHCSAGRPYADYEHFQTRLMWPGQATDLLVRVAA